MNKDIIIPLIIALVSAIIFWVVSASLSVVLVFIPGMFLSYLFYLVTCYKRTPNPDRVLPLYLLALGIQFIHFTEEYLTDFTTNVPRLLGQSSYSMDHWVVFNMVAYFVFIIGGIILFKQIKVLMVIPLFFMLVGVVLNSIAHILISIYVGAYFSGLYTAFIYLIIGPILLKRIIVETRN